MELEEDPKLLKLLNSAVRSLGSAKNPTPLPLNTNEFVNGFRLFCSDRASTRVVDEFGGRNDIRRRLCSWLGVADSPLLEVVRCKTLLTTAAS